MQSVPLSEKNNPRGGRKRCHHMFHQNEKQNVIPRTRVCCAQCNVPICTLHSVTTCPTCFSADKEYPHKKTKTAET